MPICVAGQVGVGHVFSHSGIVQDDSLGFSVLTNILAREHGLDMRVSSVNTMGQDGFVSISLRSGGRGVAHPRRGITPFETLLVEDLVGADSLFPQRAILNVLGRIYGHGILEVPASMEYALAEAVMESLSDNISDFVLEREGQNGDIFGGVTGDIAGVPVRFLLSVSGSRSGVGPDKDRGGNVPLGAKRMLMETLGIIDAPTILIGSKSYDPAVSELEKDSLMVRYNREADNRVIGRCLIETLGKGNTPYLWDDAAFASTPGTLRRRTENAGAALVQLGEELGRCSEATEKIRIAAEITRFVAEDLGGVISMSDRVHDHARSMGTMPGTSAVLSQVVTEDYIRRNRIPFVTDRDAALVEDVLNRAVPLLLDHFDEAQTLLRQIKDSF